MSTETPDSLDLLRHWPTPWTVRPVTRYHIGLYDAVGKLVLSAETSHQTLLLSLIATCVNQAAATKDLIAAARALSADWEPFTDDQERLVVAPPYIRAVQRAVARYDGKPTWPYEGGPA